MSREAFGDPPESQEPPQLCPVCGNDWHAEDCVFGKEVALRLKAERDAHKLAHALENVAMMLRKCAHRLNVNGHEDLGADAVGLLRRFDLLGSPLREVEPVKLNDEAPSNAAHWHKVATECRAEIDRIHVENARLAKEAKRLQGLLDAVHQIAGELARPSGI